MTSASSCHFDNIPPGCQRIARKLDILSTVNLALCLPLEQISLIKESLHSEVYDLKQKLKEEQLYLKSVKDDLNVCKENMAVMEKWEKEFQRLDAVLPVVKKQANVVQNSGAAASNSQVVLSCAAMNDKTSTKNGIPTLRYINDAEWSTVPSYMKLRLKLDQINSFVDAFNRKLTEKYNLLKKKKSTLKKDELSLRVSYEAQETAETKSQKLYFVLVDDLKYLGLPEKTMSSMRTILRHCHRLCEQRTGKTYKLIVRQ